VEATLAPLQLGSWNSTFLTLWRLWLMKD